MDTAYVTTNVFVSHRLVKQNENKLAHHGSIYFLHILSEQERKFGDPIVNATILRVQYHQ